MNYQWIVRGAALLVMSAALIALVGCGSESEPSGDTARFPVPTEVVPAVSTPVPTSTPAPEPSPEPAAAATPPPEPSPSEGSEAGRLPAPDFTLPSASGGSVTLTNLLEDSRGAVLVFYRGFF